MRASLLLSLILLFSLTGCDQETPESTSPPSEQTERSEAPLAEDEDKSHLVAYGEGLELTIEEVETTVERMRLMAPRDAEGRLPTGDPEWMAAPQAQVSMIRNLIQFKIIHQAAREKDLQVSEEELLERIADTEPLAIYLPLLAAEKEDAPLEDPELLALQDELDALNLSLQDVRHIAGDIVLYDRLIDHLAENFSDEMLRAIYDQTRNEIDLIIVAINNSPASSEVDDALQRFDAEIRAFYRSERHRFITPKRLVSTLLRPSPEDQNIDLGEVLTEAHQRLQAGEDHVEVAQELNLQIVENAPINPAENRQASAAEPGAVGIARSGRFGPHVWRLEERFPRERRPLDRPLRREIAAELLRNEGMTPSNRARAQEAREILAAFPAQGALEEEEINALLERLRDAGFTAHHSQFFSFQPNAVIPRIGIAETLLEALESHSLDDPVTAPTLDRDRILVARIVDRSFPDDQLYEEEKEEFRAQFLESNRHRLIDQYTTRYEREKDLKVNMSVVANRYGVIDSKPGASAAVPTP